MRRAVPHSLHACSARASLCCLPHTPRAPQPAMQQMRLEGTQVCRVQVGAGGRLHVLSQLHAQRVEGAAPESAPGGGARRVRLPVQLVLERLVGRQGALRLLVCLQLRCSLVGASHDREGRRPPAEPGSPHALPRARRRVRALLGPDAGSLVRILPLVSARVVQSCPTVFTSKRKKRCAPLLQAAPSGRAHLF